MKMQAATDFCPRKIFHCPCLWQVIGRIFYCDLRSLSQILLYFQELEDSSVEKKYCICIYEKKI